MVFEHQPDQRLLRQFFPESTHLSLRPLDDLDEAEGRFNIRPRKILNWRPTSEGCQCSSDSKAQAF
jgi:IS30 family transposase